jgi:hypothetical protein
MLSFGDNTFFNLPREYATSATYKKSMLYLNKDWKTISYHWHFHQMWIDPKMVNTCHYHIEKKQNYNIKT